MRSRDDIKEELLAYLKSQESGAWLRVQNSLVGKELLAFGAEVIQAVDTIEDSILQSYDYELANERALISLSHIHSIPVSFTKPAYIRIRLSGATKYKFNPFDITFTVGSAKFTNISYFEGTDDIVLYQGVVKTMFSDEVLSSFNYETEVDWDETVLPVSDSDVITGHSIGEAFPDSVYCFYSDDDGKGIMSEFTPLSSGEDVVCYKLYTLLDRTILVLDGDGVWGKKDYSNGNFQILWLELTNKAFSVDGKCVSATYGTLTYKVMGSSEGIEDSLNYGRQYFRSYYLKTNAVVSKQQIKEFVNSYAYIQDCNIVVENNEVTIYVKPTDSDDIGSYGNIEADLDLKGGLLTSHSLIKGTQVAFQFMMSGDVSSTLKTQIETFIKEQYAYSELDFTEEISVSTVAALIYSNFSVIVTVKFYCSDVSAETGESLQFLPDSGSMKIKNSEGAVIGYDLAGQLFTESTTDTGFIEILSDRNQWLGNYLISRDSSNVGIYGFQDSYIKKYPVDVILSVFSDYTSDFTELHCKSYGGYVYVWYNNVTYSLLAIYELDQITPQGLISNIIPVSGTSLQTVCLLDDSSDVDYRWPVYYNGNIYILYVKGTNIQIQSYTGNASSPYFVMSLPTGQTEIEAKGIYQDDSDIYIVITADDVTNTCIVIRNFSKSNVSWAVRKIVIPDEVDSIAEVKSIHFREKDVCRVVFDVDGTLVLGEFSELSEVDGVVYFMNYSTLTTLSLTNDNPVVYTADGYTWITSSEGWDIYDESSGTENLHSSDYTYSVYELTSSNVVGTVNYTDGTIVYNSDMSGVTYDYQSSVVVLEDSTFLVLNESEPIVWS